MGVWQRIGGLFRGELGRRFAQDSPVRRMGWGIAFALALTGVLYTGALPERVNLELGKPAPRQVKANREIIDRVETERLKAERAKMVDEVYEQDPKVLTDVKAEIDLVFTRIRTVQDTQGASRDEKLEQLKEGSLARFPFEVLSDLLDSDEPTLAALRKHVEQIVLPLLRGGVKEESVETFRRQVDNETNNLKLTSTQKTFVSQLSKDLIRPNLVFNAAETARRRQRAMEEVEPVRILKGQVVVDDGDIVTPEHLAILNDLGLLPKEGNVRPLFGAGLLSVILTGGVAVYLHRFRRRVLETESTILVIGLVTVITLVLAQLLGVWSGFLVPVAAGTMLLAILVDPQVALIVALVLAVAVGFMNGYDLQFALVAAVGGVAGVFGVTRVGQRSDLMRAGFLVGLANAATILSITLTGGGPLNRAEVFAYHLWGIINGIVSAILTIGSLPFFESFFGIITSVKLLEVSNPNQPLLRKLLVEAPGTYHHSIIVANLAEAAAEAVGADSLLARVGGFYHDIGKLKRPYFFIDNQFGQANPHDKISPHLSALIITSHIKDGVQLAEEHRLPSRIIDFIREHHGTTLVSYFYSLAAENGKKREYLEEEDFRYEGPKPQSKETALVMLADSCEAAVRSISAPTAGKIEGMVRRLIKERLNDGQLDQSDLTLRDLDTVARIFTRVLSGIFHPRVEYPDSVLRELERSQKV